MTTFVVCRGLPGSGKTTWARAWVAADPERRARVNRDDLRQLLHDGVWLGDPTERQVKAARDATIRALLRKDVSVVLDDTNLPQRVARDVIRNARLAVPDRPLGIIVLDFTDVDVDVCVARDAERLKPVGEEKIRDLWRRYVKGRPYPLPFPDDPETAAETVVPYVPPDGKPPAVMVDVDGTVALHSGRSPFDESRVSEDRPNLPVIKTVRAFAASGYRIVFCSGRTDACREATEAWLRQHVGYGFDALFMRAAGDFRKDAIVKRELFDRHVRNEYRVAVVLDDRNQVVEAWRALGLTVLQVAPGDF